MKTIERVLVHRLGSIGDFVVALPCIHLLRRNFPDAKIVLLTNDPVDGRAAPAMSVFGDTGLVNDYLGYPLQTRDLGQLRRLVAAVRAYGPDLLVYLVSRIDLPSVVRDKLFFHWVGVHRAVGFPLSRDLRDYRQVADGLWEQEGFRLARCLAPLGDASPERPENWDLRLSAAECAEADRLLAGAPPALIGLSVGTKQAIKDWGDDNWRIVVEGLGRPDLGIVLVGSAEERARSDSVVQNWPGPVYNCCGDASPRVSATLLRRTRMLICHDSGPMHLAAVVGTRCVALFSRLGRPGEWFPFGDRHKIFYPPSPGDTIHSIAPREVLAAARALLAEETI